MFKEKNSNTVFKCKQFYFLFIFLFLFTSSLFSQPTFASIDSLALARQDSLHQVKIYNDSIGYQYISADSPLENYYLDSIKSLVLVKDNDFVGWIGRMNSLKKNDVDYQVMPAAEKFNRPSWVLLLVFVLFISIGLIRIFFYINFHNIVYGFYNDRVLAQINREDSIATSWPYIFLYTIFTLCIGLFVTMYKAYVLKLGDIEFLIFLKISVGIALLFLIKIIFVRFIGVLFQVEKLAREYVVFLYLFYFNSVLFLMPLLLFVVFLPLAYFNYALILFLILAGILFFYRFLRMLLSLIDDLRFSIFYLILYLCTLEIAPILILVKSLNN